MFTNSTRLVPLDQETRANLPTSEAAPHLNRSAQTLRMWACNKTGPIRPLSVNGRLAWPVSALRHLVGVVPRTSPIVPEQTEDRAALKQRRDSWRALPENAWRARVAAVLPAIDAFKQSLGVTGAFSGREHHNLELRRVRAAARAYFRDVDPAGERRVAAVASAWQDVYYRIQNGLRPGLSMMDAFEGDAPLMLRIARHHAAGAVGGVA